MIVNRYAKKNTPKIPLLFRQTTAVFPPITEDERKTVSTNNLSKFAKFVPQNSKRKRLSRNVFVNFSVVGNRIYLEQFNLKQFCNLNFQEFKR